MKKTIIWAMLAMLLPVTQAWATSSYYAKGVVKVATGSASGAGKVYVTCVNKDAAAPSAPASSSYLESTEKKSSNASGASYDFYFYALPADENCKFLGWSATDGGTDLGTANPYKMTITAPTSDGTTTKTLYALFSRETTITAQAAVGGTYTVKTAGENKTVPSSFKTSDVIELEATPTGGSRFVGWVSTGASGTKWFSYDKKVSLSFAESSTIYPVFASAEEVVTAEVYKDVMDGASAKVIEIPAGTEVIVANGVTMTVKAGQRVTVNGTLRVLGALSVSGAIDGSGKVIKGTVTVTQDPNDIIEPYSAEKYEEDMCLITKYKDADARLRATTFKYQKTTTAKQGEGAITTNTGSSLLCSIAWECIVSGISTNYVKVSSPSDAVNALRCKVDVGVAVNHITNVVAVYSRIGAAIRYTEGVADQFAVMLSDATSGNKLAAELSDFPDDSQWKSTKTGGVIEQKVGKKQIRVDCANHSLDATFEYNNSSGYTTGWYLNGTTVSHGKVSRARVRFMNCDSVSVEINSGAKYESRVELFDCGKLAKLTGQDGTDLPGETADTYWRGGAYFYSGGPYDVTWGKNRRAWGGTFVNNPYVSDSANYRASDRLSVKKVGEYWVVAEREPSDKVAKVGDVEYASVKDAVQAVVDSGNPGVVRLTAHCQLTEDIEIPANANVRIELASYWIGGTARKITNRGTLEIGDGTNYQEGKGSVLGATIENLGTMIICYGNFEGNFVAKAGTIRIYDGYFNGTLTKEADGAYDIRGGNFKNSVSSLLAGDMVERKISGRYYVGRAFGAVVRSISPGRYERGYSVEALDSKQSAAFLGPILRSSYSSDEDWYYHVETCAAIKPYANWTIDAVISFDRDTAKDSVLLNSMYTERPLDRSMAADEAYRCMSPVIKEQGYYQITYSRFLAGDPAKSVSMYIGNNDADENIGTACTLEMRLYESDNSSLTIARRRFVFGAGSNAAMVRPDTGAPTFYATPEAALQALGNNGTVLLATDYSEDVTIGSAGAYTIDPNGFEFTGKVCAGSGLKVTSEGNTYTVESAGVTITVGDVANMDKTVIVGGEEVKPTEGTTSYLVPEGSTVVVTYTPKQGYMGNPIVKQITSAKDDDRVDATEEDDEVAKEIVAKIGEIPYASLADAIEAMQSGDEITVVKASVLTVGGYEMTVTLGTLTLAVYENGIEFKDGTDAEIIWPTAEDAKDVIVVTGGKYSADPTAFLAEGLEAVEKGGKYVVGVKVVIVIENDDSSAEAKSNTTSVVTDTQTSKVDTNEVAKVIEQVISTTGNETDEEVAAKQELVSNINTNTKVEGVKLTTVDEKVVDEQTQQEEVVKTNGVKAVVLAAKAVAQETAKAAEGKTDKSDDEKAAEAFKAAIEQTEKDSEITVKVEVQAKLVEYKPPVAESVEDKTGSIEFELKPEATVTVTVKDEKPVTQKVEVTNDMIDQTQKIKVSMYAGFLPVQVLHRDDDGFLIEEFTGDAIGYDENTGIVTVMISHFSSMVLKQAAVDPLAPAGATKISDGWYQNRETFESSTEFYITNVEGLKKFRDFTNGRVDDETYLGTRTGNLTLQNKVQIYSEGIFSGDRVRLLKDIDLEGDPWTPIAYNHTYKYGETSFSGGFKGLFDAGIYDANGKLVGSHVVSNLVVSSTESTSAKDYYIGFIGRIGTAGGGVKNLTIENATVSGYDYVAAVIGNASTAGVIVDNCRVIGNIAISAVRFVGGIVGHSASAVISNCAIAGTGFVKAENDGSGYAVGGIGGYCYAGVRSCSVEGISVSADNSAAGGIVGCVCKGTLVDNCAVDNMTVTCASGTKTGLVVGRVDNEGGTYAVITNCIVGAGAAATAAGEPYYAQCCSYNENLTIVGWNVVGTLAAAGVTGGTFESLPDSYVANGYAKFAQGTTPETWKVLPAAASITVDTTTTKYSTLQSAIDAVQEDQTVVVLADNTETITVTNTCPFTLDANGYTLGATSPTVPADWKFVKNGNVCSYVAKVYVAQIGSQKYESFATALTDARNATTAEGKTITVIGTVNGQNMNGDNEGITIQGSATGKFTAGLSADGNEATTSLKNMTLRNLKFEGCGIVFSLSIGDVSGMLVEGCTFDGTGSSDMGFQIMKSAKIKVDGLTIRNNTFRNYLGASKTGICLNGAAPADGGNVTIVSNLIENVSFNGIQALCIAGLDVMSNRIVNAGSWALLHVKDSSNIRFVGNELVMNNANNENSFAQINCVVDFYQKDGNVVVDTNGVTLTDAIDIARTMWVRVNEGGLVAVDGTKNDGGKYVGGHFFGSLAKLETLVADGYDVFAVEGYENEYVVAQAVASIGTTKFATLEAALPDWTNGTTLVLLRDVVAHDAITLTGNGVFMPTATTFDNADQTRARPVDVTVVRTLNLNGHTLGKSAPAQTAPDDMYGSWEWSQTDTIINYNTLLVVDTSEAGTGRLLSGGTDYTGAALRNFGAVELARVTLDGNCDGTNPAYYVIVNAGSMLVNGAAVQSGSTTSSLIASGNDGSANVDTADILVNDGAFTNGTKLLNVKAGSATVKGGSWAGGEMKAAAVSQMQIVGGIYSLDPSTYVPNGYQVLDYADPVYKYMVGVKVDGGGETQATAVTEQQKTSVDEEKLAEVVPDDEVKIGIEQSTEVIGVVLTTEAETNTQGIVITPAGVQTVVSNAMTTGSAEFKGALASASIVTVQVDVVVTPSQYVPTNLTSKTGVIAFDLKPEATVTVTTTTGGETTALSNKVDVTNEMIDRTRNIVVSIYTGFLPEQIVHTADDGSVIETFGANEFRFADGVSTMTIAHFSKLTAYEKPYVAFIGTNGYVSLDAAIAAQKAGGGTIVVVDSNVSAPSGYHFELDDNGNKILVRDTLVEADWDYIVIDNQFVNGKTNVAQTVQGVTLPAAWGVTPDGNVTVMVKCGTKTVSEEQVAGSETTWTFNTDDLAPGIYTVGAAWKVNDENQSVSACYKINQLVDGSWEFIVIDNTCVKDKVYPAQTKQTLTLPAAWGLQPTGDVVLTVKDEDGNVLDTASVPADTKTWELDTTSLMPGKYTVSVAWTDASGENSQSVVYGIDVLASGECLLDVDNRILELTRAAQDSENIVLPASWTEVGDVTLTITDPDGLVTTKNFGPTDFSWPWNTVPLIPGAYTMSVSYGDKTDSVSYVIEALAADGLTGATLDNAYDEGDVRYAKNHSMDFNMKWAGATNAVLSLDGKTLKAEPDASGMWTWNTNGLGRALYTFTNVVDGTAHEAKFWIDADFIKAVVDKGLLVTMTIDAYMAKFGPITNYSEQAISAPLMVMTNNNLKVWQNYVAGLDQFEALMPLTPGCLPADVGSAVVTVVTPYGKALEDLFLPDSGVEVNYQLLHSATTNFTDAAVFATTNTAVFKVDTSALDTQTYWKIRAVFSGQKK